jgi:hypothetical protein
MPRTIITERDVVEELSRELPSAEVAGLEAITLSGPSPLERVKSLEQEIRIWERAGKQDLAEGTRQLQVAYLEGAITEAEEAGKQGLAESLRRFQAGDRQDIWPEESPSEDRPDEPRPDRLPDRPRPDRPYVRAESASTLQDRPATSAKGPDDYTSRLLKYIPAESVALYLTLQGIVLSGLGDQSTYTWLWIIFGVGLIGTPMYL